MNGGRLGCLVLHPMIGVMMNPSRLEARIVRMSSQGEGCRPDGTAPYTPAVHSLKRRAPVISRTSPIFRILGKRRSAVSRLIPA